MQTTFSFDVKSFNKKNIKMTYLCQSKKKVQGGHGGGGGGCGVGRGNINNNLFEFDFERFDSYYLELLKLQLTVKHIHVCKQTLLRMAKSSCPLYT